MLPAAPEQASPSRPERTVRPGPEGRRRRRAPSGLFEPVQLVRSFPEALRKLHPRVLVKNPVLFVVSVGAVLTTLSALLHPAVFTWVISLWLWLTVVFANLAEAVAEGRGKAQAESLRRARTDTVALRLLHWSYGTDPRTARTEAVAATELKPLDVVVVEAGEMIIFVMIGLALIVFPKLALGLSGFETGVAVMPHVQGDPDDTEEKPTGRIRDTKKLLTTAAIIMSAFLITSSFVTTLLIPENQFKTGGQANGRALAYLAHEYLGGAFGTVYDVSTIAILWFAGASAMAGLLNLMPRYGMAPHWARAVRPMVIVFTLVAFLVTWIFDANVDAQGGAYATGVLVLITSAAIAVTIAARKAGQRNWTIGFGVISAVFLYTRVMNVIERPDGVKIGACFIAGIILVSLLSRLARAFELRVTNVTLDPMAERFIRDMASRKMRFIANEPGHRDKAQYRDKIEQIRADNDMPEQEDFVFVEVTVTDPSEFEAGLTVRGEVLHDRYRVLTLESASIPNALAALLVHARDVTGCTPHIYFEWTEGGPFSNFLRFFLFGQGEVAPVTREVLREAEPNRARRPRVHTG
ncbi:hypothetical protein [Streptomyces sp. NPDC018610]|uniref:hypothetical protein n=1 Tax=Streptomyces sp. NPDC018610 TaxID=3365049 RepID=UPI003799D2A9